MNILRNQLTGRFYKTGAHFTAKSLNEASCVDDVQLAFIRATYTTDHMIVAKVPPLMDEAPRGWSDRKRRLYNLYCHYSLAFSLATNDDSRRLYEKRRGRIGAALIEA